MKIAIFTDSFLPGVGGTENAVHEYATELAKEHEVMVFAPDYKREMPIETSYKVVRVKSIAVTKNDFWAVPALTPSLKRSLKEFKPDIIHCETMGMMAAAGNRYAKKNKIPTVYTIHTKFRYCYRFYLKSKFLAELLLKYVVRRTKKADKVFTVSSSTVPELKSYGIKQDISVIKNGCPSFNYSGETEKKEGKFQFLYVGLIIDYKNIGFTLNALSKVKEKRKDFVFKIIGRGPSIKKFKKQAKKLGLEEHVEFIGGVNNRKLLYEHYANSDLFLFSSIFDTDGLVLLEAASVGTPTVVLENTGASERIIDEKNGFVSKRDVDSYAKKILSLMDDRNRIVEVGNTARESKVNSWSSTVKEYMEHYNELVKVNNK